MAAPRGSSEFLVLTHTAIIIVFLPDQKFSTEINVEGPERLITRRCDVRGRDEDFLHLLQNVKMYEALEKAC